MKKMKVLVFAALAGLAIATPAAATCPHQGQTFPETNFEAIVANVLEYLCENGAALSSGGATGAKQDAQTSDLDTIKTNTTNAGTPQLAAGENHAGEVGNNEITITSAQTVTAASAYASGNAVGGLMTFASAARVNGASGAGGTSGMIQSAAVNSKSLQSTQMDLILFNANPSGSTCTDKSAISVAAADFDKIIGVAHVTDWTALGTPSVGQAQNLAMPYALTSNTTLYGCLVTRSTPTFTATTDISVAIRAIRN